MIGTQRMKTQFGGDFEKFFAEVVEHAHVISRLIKWVWARWTLMQVEQLI